MTAGGNRIESKVEPPVRGRQGRPIGPWVVGVSVLATLAGWFLARAMRFGPVDDAFITLRYSANWGRGAGLVFNPGESVEGFSTFLLVGLQAALVRLGVDPVAAMTVIGWASLGLLAAITMVFVARHVVAGEPVVAALITLGLTLNPMVVAWASSGMEPCLYAALVLLTLHLALTGGPILIGLALMGTAMTRLETLALTPVFALILYQRDRSLRPAIRMLAVFAIGFGFYFVARAVHFGALFPNTFYAKVDYGNSQLWRRGALYVWDFLRSLPVLSAGAALAAVLAYRPAPRWIRAVLLMLAFQLLIVVYVGGDHFAFFRFLVPAFVPLGVAALYPIFRMPRRPGTRLVPLLLALLVLGHSGVRAGLVHRRADGIAHETERRQEVAHTERSRYVYETELAAMWSDIGRALKHLAPPEATLAVITIGAIGYYSELRILDPYGLIEPAIGRQNRPLGGGYAGHEKYDVDIVLSRAPALVLLVNSLTDAPVAEAKLRETVWGDFNRALLARPEFRAAYRYRSFPVGPRHLNLHVHDEISLGSR